MMNWVKPEFGDFLAPPSKRQKTEDSSVLNSFPTSIALQKQSDVSATLNAMSNYCPKNKEELVVNKKKIEEVEFWLNNLHNETTYLILFGASGCGKFKTLCVLCKLLKIDYVEWITPMNHDFDHDQYNAHYKNELDLFEDFIIRASRYSNVLSSSSKRIIIIKDIPCGYNRNSSLFHSLLERYFGIENIRIVFIISDSSIYRDLFPEQIKQKLFVKTINFNPITQRNVSTALLNVIKKFELKKINPTVDSYVDQISLNCNGDLRNALTTLHFLLIKKSSGVSAKPIPKKKKGRTAKSKIKSNIEQDSNLSSDNKIDIFHGLGRVLYAKREDGKLTHNPQDVGDTFSSSPQLFIGMLHENYFSTFSSIHDIAKASTNLGVSDILLQDWNINSSVLGCGVSVASFGLMIANSNPIRKFQQFNKGRSKFETLVKEYKDVLEASNPVWKGTDVLMDIAPYSKYIPYFDSPHKELLLKLATFS